MRQKNRREEIYPEGFPGALVKKSICMQCQRLPAVWETQVQALGQEDFLEEEMATHSSILVCRIPWMEEPGGLQSMGSQESDMTQRLNHQICPGGGEASKIVWVREGEKNRNITFKEFGASHLRNQKWSWCRQSVKLQWQEVSLERLTRMHL